MTARRASQRRAGWRSVKGRCVMVGVVKGVGLLGAEGGFAGGGSGVEEAGEIVLGGVQGGVAVEEA